MSRKTIRSADDDEDNDEPMNQVNQIPLDFRPEHNTHTNLFSFLPLCRSLIDLI